MTEGPTSRDEALALVATIVVRVARRMAEHDAAQAVTRKSRPSPDGPTDTHVIPRRQSRNHLDGT